MTGSQDLIGLNELPTIDRWDMERRSRGAVQPVYLGDHVALCRVLARYKCFIDTTDVGFGAHLLLDGFWESWLTTFIASHVGPGDHVVDVGANHGYYTLLMADLVGVSGQVASVEPNPDICRLLRKSVAVNGFSRRVEVMEQAATAVDHQSVVLCLPPNEPKNAYLTSATGPMVSPSEQRVTVAGGRLATALAHWDRLDFLKIDVEGGEEAAIDGLFPLLNLHRPRMVLEFNAGRCATPRFLLERLKDLYGKIDAVGFDGRAHPTNIETLLDTNRTEDWLLYLERV